MSNLRLFVFVNFYLSSIQQGIQSAHVVHELFIKYPLGCNQKGVQKALSTRLYDWARDHKTMIILNGGANTNIKEKFFFFNSETFEALNFPAPFASFNEDELSLGGIMTAVGVVLPEEIYDAVNYRTASEILGRVDVLEGQVDTFFYIKDGIITKTFLKDSPESCLISILKSCSLAR